MSQYLIEEVEAAGVEVRLQASIVGASGEGRLRELAHPERRHGRHRAACTPTPSSSSSARSPTPTGLPDDVERDERGFVLTGAGEHMFETSAPGVFAIGDVRAGSVKRVASAVGEGSVVIHQVHRYLESASAKTQSPS